MPIPKIIHHVWPSEGDIIPDKYQGWMRSWYNFHPDWEFHIWRLYNLPKDLMKPESYEIMMNPRLTVTLKSDIMRLEVMRIFGGIYVDTDMQCLKEITPLLDNSLLCGWENGGSVGTSLLGCEKSHPVIEAMLNRSLNNVRGKKPLELNRDVIQNTGPGVFTGVCREMNVKAFPGYNFYQYPGSAPDERSYSKHWVTSQQPDGWSHINKFSGSNKLRVLVLNKPIDGTVRKSIMGQVVTEHKHFEIVEGITDPSIPKLLRIAQTKEKARQKALGYSDQYTVFVDDDILQLNMYNFNDMVEFMEAHKDFGAAALFREDHRNEGLVYDPVANNHICNGCMMVRKEALKDLNFGKSLAKPTCWPMAKNLYNAGWKYGYIDITSRIRHAR